MMEKPFLLGGLLAKDLLICQLCSEYYKDPRILPCDDTFCRRCLQTFFQEKQAKTAVKITAMPCPKCHRIIELPVIGISGFPLDMNIRKVKEDLMNKLMDNASDKPKSPDSGSETFPRPSRSRSVDTRSIHDPAPHAKSTSNISSSPYSPSSHRHSGHFDLSSEDDLDQVRRSRPAFVPGSRRSQMTEGLIRSRRERSPHVSTHTSATATSFFANHDPYAEFDQQFGTPQSHPYKPFSGSRPSRLASSRSKMNSGSRHLSDPGFNDNKNKRASMTSPTGSLSPTPTTSPTQGIDVNSMSQSSSVLHDTTQASSPEAKYSNNRSTYSTDRINTERYDKDSMNTDIKDGVNDTESLPTERQSRSRRQVHFGESRNKFPNIRSDGTSKIKLTDMGDRNVNLDMDSSKNTLVNGMKESEYKLNTDDPKNLRNKSSKMDIKSESTKTKTFPSVSSASRLKSGNTSQQSSSESTARSQGTRNGYDKQTKSSSLKSTTTSTSKDRASSKATPTSRRSSQESISKSSTSGDHSNARRTSQESATPNTTQSKTARRQLSQESLNKTPTGAGKSAPAPRRLSQESLNKSTSPSGVSKDPGDNKQARSSDDLSRSNSRHSSSSDQASQATKPMQSPPGESTNTSPQTPSSPSKVETVEFSEAAKSSPGKVRRRPSIPSSLRENPSSVSPDGRRPINSPSPTRKSPRGGSTTSPRAGVTSPGANKTFFDTNSLPRKQHTFSSESIDDTRSSSYNDTTTNISQEDIKDNKPVDSKDSIRNIHDTSKLDHKRQSYHLPEGKINNYKNISDESSTDKGYRSYLGQVKGEGVQSGLGADTGLYKTKSSISSTLIGSPSASEPINKSDPLEVSSTDRANDRVTDTLNTSERATCKSTLEGVRDSDISASANWSPWDSTTHTSLQESDNKQRKTTAAHNSRTANDTTIPGSKPSHLYRANNAQQPGHLITDSKPQILHDNEAPLNGGEGHGNIFTDSGSINAGFRQSSEISGDSGNTTSAAGLKTSTRHQARPASQRDTATDRGSFHDDLITPAQHQQSQNQPEADKHTFKNISRSKTEQKASEQQQEKAENDEDLSEQQTRFMVEVEEIIIETKLHVTPDPYIINGEPAVERDIHVDSHPRVEVKGQTSGFVDNDEDSWKTFSDTATKEENNNNTEQNGYVDGHTSGKMNGDIHGGIPEDKRGENTQEFNDIGHQDYTDTSGPSPTMSPGGKREYKLSSSETTIPEPEDPTPETPIYETDIIWQLDKRDYEMPTSIVTLSNGLTVIAEFNGGHLQYFDETGKFMHNVDGIKPFSITTNCNDHVIVADRRNKSVRVFDDLGCDVMQWENDQFNWISGIACTSNGNFVIQDRNNYKVGIYNPTGDKVHEFGSYGDRDTQLCMADFLAVDSKDRIILCDSGNHCIKIFNIKGVFQRKFGTRGHLNGQMEWPKGICCDANDNIIVADNRNRRVSLYSPDGEFIQHLVQDFPNPYSVCLNRSNGILGVTHYSLAGFSVVGIYSLTQLTKS